MYIYKFLSVNYKIFIFFFYIIKKNAHIKLNKLFKLVNSEDSFSIYIIYNNN